MQVDTARDNVILESSFILNKCIYVFNYPY